MKQFPAWHYRRWLPVQHPLVEDWAVPMLIALFLTMFWVSLLWPDQAPERIIVGLSVTVVFIVMAFRGYWHQDWGAYVYALAMAALCYLTLPFTEAGILFIFFSIGFLANTRHSMLSILFLAVLTLLAALQGYLLGFHGLFLVIAVMFVVFGGTMDFLFQGYMEQQRALLRSQDEAEQLARTAERERIARDLHDLLGHTLSSIRIKAELASRLLPTDTPRASGEITEIEQLARSSLQQVRAAVSGYHEGGIALEINAARTLLTAAGIRFRTSASGEVPGALDSTLATILREGVTNIVRHAHATEVSCTLTQADQRLLLRLEDDGEGLQGDPGNGMNGIKMRARIEGGVARWHSSPGAGTVLEVTLPLLPSTRPENAND